MYDFSWCSLQLHFRPALCLRRRCFYYNGFYPIVRIVAWYANRTSSDIHSLNRKCKRAVPCEAASFRFELVQLSRYRSSASVTYIFPVFHFYVPRNTEARMNPARFRWRRASWGDNPPSQNRDAQVYIARYSQVCRYRYNRWPPCAVTSAEKSISSRYAALKNALRSQHRRLGNSAGSVIEGHTTSSICHREQRDNFRPRRPGPTPSHAIGSAARLSQ